MNIFRCQYLFLSVLELVHWLKVVLLITQTSCLLQTHVRMMSCIIDRTQKKISYSFSLLLKYMLIQISCGKHWTTGNHNFLKGTPLFHKIRAIPFKLVKKLFYSPSWTHWILLTSYFPSCLISFLFHYLPESCFSSPTLMFTCFISECFSCTLCEPSAPQHCPIPKLTSASMITSWFSYCGWDLPDSPVVLVSQIQDAI